MPYSRETQALRVKRMAVDIAGHPNKFNSLTHNRQIKCCSLSNLYY